ncbi:DUF402 domain-containing protein [Dictyobacter arantiisoli]|uniref:DUF402 domain-containing protein n=1 Tax=Dictyobacter arantiisoli TaxID=2014874 RepID=A0A5A5TEC2_9CHLR|nr:DUF402 domain-containing protein [Dictyobacter arantiisoli]GCF09677.1 hypothetical protein KDI_32410 [Dictyobacter arantiisoli]
MQRDFRVECHSYDKLLRGSWRAYSIQPQVQLGTELSSAVTDDCVRLWLPAGTPMNWASGTRDLRNNCVQFYWPGRWFMLSAFYNQDVLIHTYANIIQPAHIVLNQLSYVDLDLSILFEPDLNYEVLTQAEFEHMSAVLEYDETTRVSALMALQTVTSLIQRSSSTGLFAVVPHRLDLTNLHTVVAS